MRGKFHSIEKAIRVYAYPENYSLVWQGNISIDKLFEKEREIYDSYKRIAPDLISQEKEINYLTPKERFEFKLNEKHNYQHSKFLSDNKNTITFARIDNPLFCLWADIYKNNKNLRSEVGIKLAKDTDVIDKIILLFEETNFKKKTFSPKKRESIIKKINMRYKKY